MSTSSKEKSIFRGHIREFDGLRAVGSAMVLFNHFWPGQRIPFLFNLMQMNWMAMDSFFVMSGFLIAGILLDSRDRPDYFGTYYLRRSLRIFPVYYLVLSLMTLGLIITDGGLGYQRFVLWGSPLWFFCYLGNVAASFRGFPPDETFHPLWSLQVEEQFYLALPLLIFVLNRRALSRLLWVLVFVSPVVRIVWYYCDPTNQHALYVFLPCRMEGLAFGSLIALRFRSGPWVIPKKKLTILTGVFMAVAGAMAALGGYVWWSALNRTVGLLISPLACALLILWLICFRDTPWTGLLRIQPLEYLGRISYGIYLFHMPVSHVVDMIAGRLQWPGYHGSFVRLAVSVAVTVGVASLSWFLFEKPILSLKDRLTARVARARLPASGSGPRVLKATS